jgi:hypothetical protein
MFDPPLNEIAEDVRKDVEEQTARMFEAQSLQLFAAIVRRTPVDKGTARGGWQVSILRPDLSGGPANKNAAITRVPKNPALLPFWLSNPFPWIEVLEFGGYGQGSGTTEKTGGTGFSLQAPRGMIRVTLAEAGLT